MGINAFPPVNVVHCMSIVRAITMAIVSAAMSCAACGQSGAAAASLSFEIATVTMNEAGGTRGPVRMRPEGVTGTNVTLMQLMRFAYELQDSQISGPDWIKAAGYDIVAKPKGSASAVQLREMLRTLLEDRFKLRTHRDTRDLAVYWLLIAEGGPKLRDPKEEEAFNAAHAGKLPFRPGLDGVFSNKDLPGFAARLSGYVGRTVVDKTGIEGRYWFQLEWAAGDQPGTASPALLTAMQEQLGLKLEERNAPTEVLVIDHVEKLSADKSAAPGHDF